jgi:branched-chain amino acid transport system substrate-binding protein
MIIKNLKYSLIIVMIASFLVSWHKEDSTPIHIALVAPLTGNSSSSGNAYLQGVRMYLDEINHRGGINGKKLVLDIYDDQNNTKLAVQKANEIVRNNRALGVIGHHYSSCSIAGGNIYKEHGIPAISPTSTNIDVTLNNPWYFRVTFNDNYQARFLANYAEKIFQKKQCILITESRAYGAYLSDVIEQFFKRSDENMLEKYVFDIQKSSIDDQLKDIVRNIQNKNFSKQSTFIFIAGHVPEGIQLIQLIRNAGMDHIILLPDAFAGTAFASKITSLKSEILNPGYYTNNLYVASPFIYDIANESTQIFKQSYVDKFSQYPDWRAAFAYDAARLMVHAIQEKGITGKKQYLSQERKSIRESLQSINNPQKGIKGLTGITIFDSNGDAARHLYIARFYHQKLVAAYTQLKNVNSAYSSSVIEKMMANKSITVVDNQYMYQTSIVYTGVNLNAVDQLNITDQSTVIDFNIWFKYRGDINAANIKILNALEPVTLGKPVQKSFIDGEHYEMYHVKGKFQLNTTDMYNEAGNHMVGFSFRHAEQPGNIIVYVSDISEMNDSNNNFVLQEINASKSLFNGSNYSAKNILYYSDISHKKPLGNPKYLSDSTNGGVEFSCYNFFISIVEKQLSLRRITWNYYLNLFICITALIIITAMIFIFRPLIDKYPRSTWILQFILGYMLLICSEPLIIKIQQHIFTFNRIEIIKQAYDVFWWILPSILINNAIKRFVWIPLEQKTERRIPEIVTNSVKFLIYLLTLFGIIAYVFDQKLTSLLATSGVLAMIIGLAIQVNIANIFSGIVINIEQPFRIGDWIKIDHKYKGKVIDITWRTTRILTHEGNILSFPNSYTSEAAINNYCYPDQYVWIKIIIHVNPTYSPDLIKKVCTDAMLSIDGLVKDFEPVIRFKLTDWCADYVLLFCIDDYGKKLEFKSIVYERIWIHLNRIGIEPAVTRQEIHMFKGIKDRGEEALSPLSILNEIDIFKVFSEDIKLDLSQKMHPQQFQPEEPIIKQGDEGDSLFIIVEGAVSVRILIDKKQVEVDRMGANTFFGEMALLTGEPRTASIVAISNCLLYEITKCDIAPLFQQYQEMTEILSKELTRRTINRQQKKDRYNKEQIDKEALKNSFFSKISNYFGLNKKHHEIDSACVDTDID